MIVQYPQVLLYENDGRLAALLQPHAEAHHWALRQPRQLDACVRLLRRARPGVLVLKVGRDLIREFTLLERVRWLCPEASAVVVADMHNAALAGLAWHLGAHYVLMPPQPTEQLANVLDGLMEVDTSRPGFDAFPPLLSRADEP